MHFIHCYGLESEHWIFNLRLKSALGVVVSNCIIGSVVSDIESVQGNMNAHCHSSKKRSFQPSWRLWSGHWCSLCEGAFLTVRPMVH